MYNIHIVKKNDIQQQDNEAPGKEMRKNVDLKKEVFGNERNDSRFKRR